MKRIYLLTVLIFCTFTVSSKAQDSTINNSKFNKNTVYLQGAINRIEDVNYNNTRNLSLDLSYARTFNKIFSGDIGVRYSHAFNEGGSLGNKFSLYLGGGVDIRLFNQLYLIPKINVGITQMEYFYWQYEDEDLMTGGEIIMEKKWDMYLGARLNLEYRFKSWRIFTGIDYEHIFGKYSQYNFAAKIGIGYSF